MPIGIYTRTPEMYLSRRGNIPWNKGKKGVYTSWNKGKNWSDEVKLKMKKPHLSMRGTKQSDEHKEKRRVTQLGEKNHNWKGGISSENMKIRNSVENKTWTKNCMVNENFTCRSCGACNGNGKTIRLQVHHILNFAQYPELRFAEENGVVFCKDCHNLFHRLYGIKNNNSDQLKDFLENK
jgi:5-methylcytosine-specific restriction endonuclease McrA